MSGRWVRLGPLDDKPMTDPKHDRIMAAVKRHQVHYGKSIVHEHFLVDGVYTDHTMDECPDVSQTITDALALAAAEGAYEGLRSVWQQPDAVTFSTLLGRVIAAQQKAEAEVGRRRGELVKCSS